MSEQSAFEAFAQRDLWQESRKKSAAYQSTWWILLLSAIWRVLFPKKRLPMFGTSARAMAVDLNKYRPDVNVELLIDQGVRVFMLRVGGPTRWVYGAWAYEVDVTFVPYYERIRKYAKEKGAKVIIIGYGVHNAWANEVNNYQGLDPQVRWLKEATRNHICDQYSWDDEVGECWKDGKETTITGVNLVKSISICMDQTFLEFEKHPTGLPKIPVHYSANWFMKKYAALQYQAWLDNNNRDTGARRFMTWRAWLPTVFSVTFLLISELFDKLLTPTGIQENAYLRMGSELAADWWQFTFTAMGPWCGPQSKGGIDASVSYGPSATLVQYFQNANIPFGTEPPQDPPKDPPVGDIAVRLAALESSDKAQDARLKVLEEFRDGVKAA